MFRPPHVSPGSPDQTNCPVTAALTLASSRTSAHCARRSSPAAITYPNTRRSTAAPGPAGLSEPTCDTFSWPTTCPVPTHPARPGFEPVGCGIPSGLLVLRKQNFHKNLESRLLLYPHSLLPPSPPCGLSSTVPCEQLVLD